MSGLRVPKPEVLDRLRLRTEKGLAHAKGDDRAICWPLEINLSAQLASDACMDEFAPEPFLPPGDREGRPPFFRPYHNHVPVLHRARNINRASCRGQRTVLDRVGS